jgi:hypothetical protein
MARGAESRALLPKLFDRIAGEKVQAELSGMRLLFELLRFLLTFFADLGFSA